MKTIVDTEGRELFASSIEIDLKVGEIEVDALRTVYMENPYYDFETESFYDNI